MGKVRPLKVDATYDDLCGVPENFVAEMFDGELYATPRPAIPHAHAASVLGFELGGPFHRGRHGPGGWWILDEPELHFGKDVLVPDLAGWRREKLAALPTLPYFTQAPDWICEVLSPSTESLDRVKKLRIYARVGVEHAWLVNPVLQTLEVFTLTAGRWTLVATHEGSDFVRAEPFDAIELELGALWA
ncbi:MAG: Uma2 family endonuclease [Gammaproteobacteria bacterium]